MDTSVPQLQECQDEHSSQQTKCQDANGNVDNPRQAKVKVDNAEISLFTFNFMKCSSV